MSLEQSWDPLSYQRDTAFISALGEGVLDWLNPKAGERILDLACGDGKLTRKIVDSGADAVGVDSSDDFVRAACNDGLDVRLANAEALEFDSEFNAVFSNAALHWMLQPEKVIGGVKRALKPEGRFVGEFGGFGNIAAVSTAMTAIGEEMGGDKSLTHPWFFPTAEHYSQLLEDQGFRVDECILFARPTPLPNGLRPWLKVIRHPFFDQFGERADLAFEKVEAALKPSLCDHVGQWSADYVRLRFHASLEK